VLDFQRSLPHKHVLAWRTIHYFTICSPIGQEESVKQSFIATTADGLFAGVAVIATELPLIAPDLRAVRRTGSLAHGNAVGNVCVER